MISVCSSVSTMTPQLSAPSDNIQLCPGFSWLCHISAALETTPKLSGLKHFIIITVSVILWIRNSGHRRDDASLLHVAWRFICDASNSGRLEQLKVVRQSWSSYMVVQGSTS